MKCSKCKYREFIYNLNGFVCHNYKSPRHTMLADSECECKCGEPIKPLASFTNVFVDKSKDAIPASIIRNTAYSTLVSIKYALDTFEEILSTDSSKNQIVLQNLYHVREQMFKLLELIYNIAEDDIKISDLIVFVNQSLAENSETDTLPTSLHEALSNLSNK